MLKIRLTQSLTQSIITAKCVCLSKLPFNWGHSISQRAEPWKTHHRLHPDNDKALYGCSLSLQETDQEPETAVLTTAWLQWDLSAVLPPHQGACVHTSAGASHLHLCLSRMDGTQNHKCSLWVKSAASVHTLFVVTWITYRLMWLHLSLCWNYLHSL